MDAQNETRGDGPTDELTSQVIGAIIEVSHVLGPGFLEKVYRRALAEELT